MASLKRVSLSIPGGLADNLDYISKRLGVSRSAFVTQLLLEAQLDSLASLLSSIPEQPSEADIKRFRGDSKVYVREQLERLQKLQGGLFDDSAH
tara:strand:- start:479 stop:760 length:282 start_codon:yes stop_codon:yes gene_type:complete